MMIKKFVFTLLLLISLSFSVSGAYAVNGYEIVAVYGSTPTIDGELIGWSDANYVQFNNTKVYVKQDGVNLYIGVSMAYPMVTEPNATIVFDVNHDESKLLQSDDLMMWVFRNGSIGEARVKDWEWTPTTARGWNAEIFTREFSWEAEFNITYSKIEVVAGVEKTMGVAFLATSFHFGEYRTDSWPPDHSQIINNPSTWGDLTSTGYNWVPEFPSFLILPLLMIATLLAVIVYRRKQS